MVSVVTYVSSSAREEIIVLFKMCVRNSVLVELHPSVDIGSLTGLGLGWPKPIHKAMPMPVAKPARAPLNFKREYIKPNNLCLFYFLICYHCKHPQSKESQ